MAARRGKSQARRNDGNGLPGWAWMILGIVIALVAVLVVPRYLKSDGNDGFFRPQPNTAAQPPASATEDDEVPEQAPTPGRRPAPAATQVPAAPELPEYDFYTVLPEQEVALTDAELAASAREEAERQRRTLAAQRQREQQLAAAEQAATPPVTPRQLRPARSRLQRLRRHPTAPATSSRPARSAPRATPRRSRPGSPCSA